ncbi:DHS-like NAD/FAD-binding domain-containing protein [Entophlyctis helioformis]|nr:DHS-like NAD/FAD-binding domain-containing protein [Entophlyctis helioformis]
MAAPPPEPQPRPTDAGAGVGADAGGDAPAVCMVRLLMSGATTTTTTTTNAASTSPSNTNTNADWQRIARAVFQAKRCVLVTGAGVSVSAGIPDFRSEDGLYNLVKEKYPDVVVKGRDLFDATLFRDSLSTQLFYTFMCELRLLTAQASPTRTHSFIKDLADSGRMLRCYTQNIDGLEARAGLCVDMKPPAKPSLPRSSSVASASGSTTGSASGSALPPMPPMPPMPAGSASAASTRDDSPSSPSSPPKSPSVSQSQQHSSASLSQASAASAASNPTSPAKTQVVLLHGDLSTVVCSLCQAVNDFTDAMAGVFATGKPPACPTCIHTQAVRAAQGKRETSIGLLRPNIVLYNEHHRQGDQIANIQSTDMKKRPDLLIVMGTSLKVVGVKRLVKDFAKAVHATKNGICIFINATDVQLKEWESVFDYHIVGKADEVVERLWAMVAVLDDEAERRRLKREADKARRERKAALEAAAVTPIDSILRKTKSTSSMSSPLSSSLSSSSGSSASSLSVSSSPLSPSPAMSKPGTPSKKRSPLKQQQQPPSALLSSSASQQQAQARSRKVQQAQQLIQEQQQQQQQSAVQKPAVSRSAAHGKPPLLTTTSTFAAVASSSATASSAPHTPRSRRVAARQQAAATQPLSPATVLFPEPGAAAKAKQSAKQPAKPSTTAKTPEDNKENDGVRMTGHDDGTESLTRRIGKTRITDAGSGASGVDVGVGGRTRSARLTRSASAAAAAAAAAVGRGGVST